MPTSVPNTRFPKVPYERRCGAFCIDFVTVWLISLPFSGSIFAQLMVFLVAWLGLRVVLAAKNQGQSLGRWALDMKLVDAKFGKIPGLLELSKREGISGLCALLAMMGLTIGLGNGISLLLLIAPLSADCGVAFADSQTRQAFHDRVARTLVVPTRRGYSLDLRIKKLADQVTRKIKRP